MWSYKNSDRISYTRLVECLGGRNEHQAKIHFILTASLYQRNSQELIDALGGDPFDGNKDKILSTN